jgi:hypothetical protein
MATNTANFGVTNAGPVNTRAIRDINYIANIALPVAANTVNTNSLDLIQATPYPTTQYVIAQVLTGASNASANNKNINVVLQDSADNSNFANIALLAAPLLTVTDNTGNTPAGAANVLLPPGVRRYVRAQAVGEANGGNASNANLTFQLLF